MVVPAASWRLAIVYDHIGAPADVISGLYPVPRSLTLNLTLKVKCKVKGHSCASCTFQLIKPRESSGVNEQEEQTPAEVMSLSYRVAFHVATIILM